MKISALPLFLLFMLIGFNCLSQTNFVQGYYVTFSLDTIHGLIEYRPNGKNIKYCTYKPSPNAPATRYSPEDVFSYVLQDKIVYRGYSVRRRNADKNIFLEVIVKGNLNLLKGHGATYYLETEAGRLIELPRFKRGLVTMENKKNLNNPHHTRGILKSLFSAHPELLRKIDNIPLSFISIKDLVVQYNQLEGKQLLFVKEPVPIKIKPHLSFGILTSFRLSSLTIYNQAHHNSKDLDGLHFNFSPSMAVGGMAQLFIPKIDETFKLNYYLIYGKKSFYLSQIIPHNNNNIFVNYAEIGNALTVQKSFLKPIGIFVEGGIEYNHVFARRVLWRQENFSPNAIHTEYVQVQDLVSPAYLGAIVGLGKSYDFGKNFCLTTALKYSWLSRANNNFDVSINQTAQLQINVMYK